MLMLNIKKYAMKERIDKIGIIETKAYLDNKFNIHIVAV